VDSQVEVRDNEERDKKKKWDEGKRAAGIIPRENGGGDTENAMP
jgi:hypothetical protein